jgi:uncharacterized damage-inducible protein DinB
MPSMIPPVWYERKFDFSFPAGLLPNMLARLRGTPARLEENLRGAVEADGPRTAKPEGKWSAQEHAGHLLNLEPLWLARVDDFASGATQLTVTDLSNRATDEANYNGQLLAEILAGFRSSRERLLRRVMELDSDSLARSIAHPRLKVPMRLVDHLYFVAEHDDHHLAQIWRLTRT